MANPSLKEEQRERLALVARIKESGVKELGLTETKSYETVYLKSMIRISFVVEEI